MNVCRINGIQKFVDNNDNEFYTYGKYPIKEEHLDRKNGPAAIYYDKNNNIELELWCQNGEYQSNIEKYSNYIVNIIRSYNLNKASGNKIG